MEPRFILRRQAQKRAKCCSGAVSFVKVAASNRPKLLFVLPAIMRSGIETDDKTGHVEAQIRTKVDV